MSDALLNQGWDNDEPTPIFWETVREILNAEPKKPKQPRNKDGRYAKND